MVSHRSTRISRVVLLALAAASSVPVLAEEERMFVLAVPAETAPKQLIRGDSDGNATVDITDVYATLGALFLGREEVACEDAADTNDDGEVTIADAVVTLNFLFSGGNEIAAPGPRTCGFDMTEDLLGCNASDACETPVAESIQLPPGVRPSAWWLGVFGYDCGISGGGISCTKCDATCSIYVCDTNGENCEEVSRPGPDDFSTTRTDLGSQTQQQNDRPSGGAPSPSGGNSTGTTSTSRTVPARRTLDVEIRTGGARILERPTVDGRTAL